MNLKIWNEEERQGEPVFLQFERDGYGSVNVIAVDDTGARCLGGNLIKFRPDGTIYRYGAVNRASEFQLDEEGRIKIVDE